MAKQRIFTPTFMLLCLATLFFFISQSAMFPVLPRHVSAMGGGPAMVGLVVGILLVPAVFLRPWMGRLIDARGRKVFIVGGLVVSFLSIAGYGMAPNIPTIFLLRLLHGAAMASFYPGATTLAGDLSPTDRRAEAFSYFSMFLFAGIALGPIIGEHFYIGTGPSAAFGVAAATAVVGALIALRLPNVVPTDVPQKGPLLHRAALFPAVVLGSVALTSGGLHAFIPLYVVETGGGDSRWFFALYAAVIIVLRTFVGRVADRFGRSVIVVPGTFLCGAASFVLVGGSGQARLVAAAILFGLGWGAMFPGLYALIMDRVSMGERGSATGTFTAAFDLAFGGGQVVLGSVLEATSFATIFALGGISASLGGIFYMLRKKDSDARFPAMQEAR